MNEFLAMGGYAAYVWSAYSITAVVLIMSILIPLTQKRQIIKRIRRMQEED